MMKYIVLCLLAFSLVACSKPSTNNQLIPADPTPVENSQETLSASESGEIESTPSAAIKTQTKPSRTPMAGDMVVLNTSKGEIVLKLYPKDAPKTVDNFLSKAEEGFYEGLTFHRVEDWVIQGGDPEGTGRGGSTMPAEYNKREFKEGSLGIARGMDRTKNNDSQFFICSADCSWLTNDYTNFGEVVEGMEIVKDIAIGDTIESILLTDEEE